MRIQCLKECLSSPRRRDGGTATLSTKPTALYGSELIYAGAGKTVALVCAAIFFCGSVSAQTTDDVIAADLTPITHPADAKRGTLLLEGEGGYTNAPILNTGVKIQVAGLVARATVRQQFRNPDVDWKEGIYVFPLPENAAVDHLRLHVGERVIEGQIKEREQARKTYQNAKQAGKRATLVEQERPNVFTTSVANIGPQEIIIVEIEYQQILKYDTGTFNLRFPTVVGPRYIPGNVAIPGFSGSGWAHNTSEVPDAARVTPPVVTPDQGKINPLSIVIDIDMGMGLEAINSPYHDIEITKPSATSYRIALQAAHVPADRDFVLEWEPVNGGVPKAALFREKIEQEEYALIMIMPPDRERSEILNREIIFVIDTSGSMAGTSIVQAKAALELALLQLKPGDRFNVIQFNSRTSALFPRPRAVTERSLLRGQNYVRALEAGGGTEMAPAVELALTNKGAAYDVRQVVFLTDGSVGNEDALFGLIEQSLADSRLFTVGIGSAPNSHFMRRAAIFGRGTHTYIGSAQEVMSQMDALFQKLESPVLHDIRVNWGTDDPVESWPQKIPDLYLGEPLLLTAKARSLPANISISGGLAGADWQADLALNGGQDSHGIGALWARRKISALMDQGRAAAEADGVRKRIVSTALKHHLVSRYTSLVAVDVTPARQLIKPLNSRNVPTNLPAGWKYEKVFGGMPRTATPAALDLIIGFCFCSCALLLGLFCRRALYV